MHNVVNDSDQRFNCIYCGKNLVDSKWKSDFCEDKHYKLTICECGKEARMKVEFFGSGHDNWEKESTIEDKIEFIE